MTKRWTKLVLMMALLGTSFVLSACQNMNAADPTGGSQFATPYEATWYKGRPG